MSVVAASGGEAELKEQLEESMKEEIPAAAAAGEGATELNLTNENVDEDEDGLDFEDIVFLGQHSIADPKNEASIHSQIREHNVLHDLGSDDEQYQTVTVQVSNHSLKVFFFGGIRTKRELLTLLQSCKKCLPSTKKPVLRWL